MNTQRHGVARVVVVATALLFTLQLQARIVDDDIVGIWLFDSDDEPGLDSSGNELNAVVNGNVGIDEGVFGTAVDLNGNGDTLELPSFGLDFPTKSVTIVTWVNLQQVKDQDLFSIVPLDPDRILCSLPWGGGAVWSFGGAAFSANFAFDDAWVDNWKHFAFFANFSENRDEKRSGIYLDGEELKIFRLLAGEWKPRDASFHIGGRPGTSIGAMLDEFAIFNRVLSQDDIKLIKNSGLARAALHEDVQPAGKAAATWAAIKTELSP